MPRIARRALKYGPVAMINLLAVATSYRIAVGVRTGRRLDTPMALVGSVVTGAHASDLAESGILTGPMHHTVG